MNFGGQTPTIVVLKEGTDTSQGRGQTISNINACLAIQETLQSTLGPLGSDILIVEKGGKTTISNDGATILKLLDVVHPAAKILVDVSRAQDAEVGDGTTSVTVLAGELLREAKAFVEDGISTHIISKGLTTACEMAISHIKELAVKIDYNNESEFRDLLKKCAATAMSSKLINKNSDLFTKLVVDAVLSLDQNDLNEKLIGIKKVSGGSIEDSFFVDGVAFKKTFAYAGFEQQPKSFTNPKIACLNIELELKAERDNAEVRVSEVQEYQNIVDAEWTIIYSKLQEIVDSGANIVLSILPIGDLATQFFADRDIFCAGRVTSDDMNHVIQAIGATLEATTSSLSSALGTCASFEEIQIGGERYNIFRGCPSAKTCTIVLRGGAEQFIAEVERSLHDAIMIVKQSVSNYSVVAGGGAIEMELSKYLRDYSKTIPGKIQLVIGAFARALEVIPRQICTNAGFDGTDILNQLRMRHSKGETWAGVDFNGDSGVADNMSKFVWEPSLVKINAIQSATEAACLVLSVDETIRNEESQPPQAGPTPPSMQRGRGFPQ